jgi:prevent-host-death family protein
MPTLSANEAKARFGQMLDTARRDPVIIEKHGRAVAVVLSKEDYDDLLQTKLMQLRAEVQIGIDASQTGRSTACDSADHAGLADEIKAAARERARAKA